MKKYGEAKKLANKILKKIKSKDITD